MVVLSDYECPACRALNAQFESYWKDSTLSYAVIFKHWPLPRHRFADVAAASSLCASQQGAFKQMHNILFENQQKLGVTPWIDLAKLAAVRNIPQFESCLGDPDVHESIRAQSSIASTINATGTPTIIFPGGTMLTGIPSKPLLDSILKANRLLIMKRSD